MVVLIHVLIFDCTDHLRLNFKTIATDFSDLIFLNLECLVIQVHAFRTMFLTDV